MSRLPWLTADFLHWILPTFPDFFHLLKCRKDVDTSSPWCCFCDLSHFLPPSTHAMSVSTNCTCFFTCFTFLSFLGLFRTNVHCCLHRNVVFSFQAMLAQAFLPESRGCGRPTGFREVSGRFKRSEGRVPAVLGLMVFRETFSSLLVRALPSRRCFRAGVR